MTQLIRLILPDLLEDRLAKLTEDAAHVNVIIGAVAQHGLRVASVTHWLQRQALSPVSASASLDSSAATTTASARGR